MMGGGGGGGEGGVVVGEGGEGAEHCGWVFEWVEFFYF